MMKQNNNVLITWVNIEINSWIINWNNVEYIKSILPQLWKFFEQRKSIVEIYYKNSLISSFDKNFKDSLVFLWESLNVKDLSRKLFELWEILSRRDLEEMNNI